MVKFDVKFEVRRNTSIKFDSKFDHKFNSNFCTGGTLLAGFLRPPRPHMVQDTVTCVGHLFRSNFMVMYYTIIFRVSRETFVRPAPVRFLAFLYSTVRIEQDSKVSNFVGYCCGNSMPIAVRAL